MTRISNEAFLCGHTRYKHFEPFRSAHSRSQSLHLFRLNALNMLSTYIYHHLTSYMFQCLLHHLQADHCVTRSKIICFLQCRYVGHAVKYRVHPSFLNSPCCYNV